MSMDGERHNPAQLKDDIDNGRTGDKVGGFDPGAAPLGTDDEAAGTPVPSEAVAQARAEERSNGLGEGARRNGAEPSLQPDGAGGSGPRVAPALLGAVVGVLMIVGALVLLL